MEDPKYATFSESDATDSLQKCLDYFFTDDIGQKKYEFSDAYLKYSKFADDKFVTTKRLYNIIKHTQLVSEKQILRTNSMTGYLYLIDKFFLEKVKRYVRLKSGAAVTESEPTDNDSKQTSPESAHTQRSTSSFIQVNMPITKWKQSRLSKPHPRKHQRFNLLNHQDTQAKISHMTTELQKSAHRIDNMEQDTTPTAKTLKTVTGHLKQLLKDYQKS